MSDGWKGRDESRPYGVHVKINERRVEGRDESRPYGVHVKINERRVERA